MVSRDWCHMSFGIIAEGVLTGYSQNPSQSLRYLRSWAVTLRLRKTPASHPEVVFNAGDDDNNNNNNNDNNNDHDDHDDDNDNDISDNDIINNNNNNNNNNSNNNNNWLTNLCDNYRQKKVNELKHNFKLGNIIAVKFKLVFLSIPLLTFEGFLVGLALSPPVKLTHPSLGFRF